MTQRTQVVVAGLGGIGGIGGAIAGRMAERDRHVVGMDMDVARTAQWHATTGSRSVSTLDAVDWDDVRCVFIVVRAASQVESVLSDNGIRSALSDGASAFIITGVPAELPMMLGLLRLVQ